MSGINTKKVVVGGLLAAVVFFAIDAAIFGFLLTAEIEANTARLGLDPAAMMSAAGITMWVVQEVAFGQITVWTYAAMRPRFGPGPGTAMYAGLVLWLAVFLMFAGMTQGGIFTTSLLWKMAIASIVSTMAGSVAGAWAYKE